MYINIIRKCLLLYLLFFGIVPCAFSEPNGYPVKPTQQAPRQTQLVKPAANFGGASSVGAQLKEDALLKKSIFSFPSIDRALAPWLAFKKSLQQEIGLQFGVDYQVLYQAVNESLTNERDAAGGIFRIYGKWTMIDRDGKDKGSLVFKVENRQRFTNIPPSALGSQFGYNGLTGMLFSNIHTVLNTLYWEQYFFQGRAGLAIGRLDPTDFIDTLGYANPWTTFQNLSILVDPSIALPDTGVGAVGGFWLDNKINIGAGIYDANGLMTELKSYQYGAEFFTHIEVGYSPSQKERLTRNVHLVYWEVDARKHSGIPKSDGIAISANWLLQQTWLPFFRAGISNGKAALMKKSITVGAGYSFIKNSDVLACGVNWGEPSGALIRKNQFTTELFYRIQLAQHITITPDIQWIYHPAANPTHTQAWVFGLRARLEL